VAGIVRWVHSTCAMGTPARGAPRADKTEAGSPQKVRLLYGAEVMIEPVEGVFHHGQERRGVASIVEDTFFVGVRRAEGAEQRLLASFHREDET
jgi:hypothetical protein